jgi:multiple sugar transport system ATP-binding protein
LHRSHGSRHFSQENAETRQEVFADKTQLSNPFPAGPAGRIASTGVTEIVLGVRPENIAAQPSAGSAPFTARVELVEPMGAETFLHLRTAAHALIARVHPGVSPALGSTVTLHLDLTSIHLFDPQTTRAV